MAIPALACVRTYAQTIYGGAGAPTEVNGGYLSDYQPGTTVLADGSVAVMNGAVYEHGNTIFLNDGSWNSSAGGVDLFTGSGNSTIAGSTAPNFFHLRLNTGPASVMDITNAQGAGVAGEVQFNNGITTTVRTSHAAGSLRFADNAVYTGGNTDTQHVNGYVTKTGDDAFTFPIGSGTDLRTLAIGAPAAGTGISAAWFAGSPASVTDPSDGATHPLTAVAAPIKSVSPVGFWDWINVAGSDDGTQITASMPDVTGFFPDVADVRLVGWDGAQWIALSTGATATGLTENSTVSGSIPAGVSITALALGSINQPLPVILASFEGRAMENSSYLQWTTTEETNASHFEIQRSRDARTFESVGTVTAKGESKALVHYDFTDGNPGPGSHYYRLKQVDLDNTYSFSRTIVVRFEGSERITLYPNPTTNLLRIDSDSPVSSVKVFNSKGINVIPEKVLQDSFMGSNVLEINLSGVPSGIYVVKVNDKSFRIMKN